jgi:transcriptional regulator with XRE-family HTH domain
METIGGKITKLRKERNLAQKYVADYLEIDVRTLRNIENDEKQPAFDKVENLAKLFKVNINEITNYKLPSISQKIYNDNAQDYTSKNAAIIEEKNEQLLESYKRQIEILTSQLEDKNKIIKMLEVKHIHNKNRSS